MGFWEFLDTVHRKLNFRGNVRRGGDDSTVWHGLWLLKLGIALGLGRVPTR